MIVLFVGVFGGFFTGFGVGFWRVLFLLYPLSRQAGCVSAPVGCSVCETVVSCVLKSRGKSQNVRKSHGVVLFLVGSVMQFFLRLPFYILAAAAGDLPLSLLQ